ncbi:nucleoside phosphorylase domain-containing protein [Aspergillus germanicus]
MWSRYWRSLSEKNPEDKTRYRDLLQTQRQSLAFRQLEKIKIDCSFLPTSKWGVLGDNPASPAWLLYLQFQFSQPPDCKIANASIKLIFETATASGKAPMCETKLGPILTEYFGPRETTNSQWPLHGYTWPIEDDESGLHRRVEWILTEGDHPRAAILHHDQLRVGLVLLHDSEPFSISVRIQGQLQGSQRWLKFSDAPSSAQSLSIRVLPLSHQAPLDAIAESLNKDMTDLTFRDYVVGWICALPNELAAAKGMLDEVHANLPNPEGDHNNYTLGSIGPHNIVVACLPAGSYGTTPAAIVATRMLATFPSIRFSLMVGIGAGVPNQEADIRLGDVVVSQPIGRHGGVVQYDRGKALTDDRFERTGALNKPPQVLLATLARMQAECMVCGHRIVEQISEMVARHPHMKEFTNRGQDHLFQPDYPHKAPSHSCESCDASQHITRSRRDTEAPAVHYGCIASGNQVIKCGETRDRLAQELGVICFEMEAAGLMDSFPCLVIRGICDYADSHKNKDWQKYAATAAAAYAKEFLLITPARQVEITPKAT